MSRSCNTFKARPVRIALAPAAVLVGLSLALVGQPGSARAEPPLALAVADTAVSYLFDDSVGALRTQASQIRARQLRVRQTSASRSLPLIDSTVSISDERRSAPLKARDRGLPAGLRIAPNTAGRVNTYFSGRIHSGEASEGGRDLTTRGVTIGADYSFDDNFLIGLAVTRMHGDYSRGNALAAYLSLEPIDELFFDFSAASGSYSARAFGESAFSNAFATGQSRGYSFQFSHSRHYGDWSIAPFSRYEWIETDGQVLVGGFGRPAYHSQWTVAIGGLVTTRLGTPLGTLHPSLLLELQRETTTPTGVASPPVRARQGLVGLGLTTRLSREVSAFAESRLRQEQGSTPASEKRALLGLRMLF